jgi:ferredoxin
MVAKVDVGNCIGCGACEDACPSEAIKVDDVAKIDGDKCTDCGACVDECPQGCISLE